MSRDFTPVQRYISNKDSGYDLWLQNIEIEYGGQKKKLFTEEEQAARLKYRNLAVALSDTFLRVYKDCPEATVAKLEEYQIKMQEALEKGSTSLYACDVPKEMKDWFLGRLDPSFYYCEKNDQLFYEWIVKNLK